MTTQNHARIVREMIEAVLSPDWAVVGECYAADAELIDPLLPEPVRGREAIVQLYQGCREHEPDMQGQIRHIIVEGDMVAAEWETQGTVQTPFPGMPESVVGKRVEIPEVNIIRMRDGKIIRNTVYADTGAVMRQLGLLPDS